MSVQVAVLAEVVEGERRVAITPEAVGRLSKLGIEVTVQAGAGSASGFGDDQYKEADAKIADDAAAAIDGAEVIVSVNRHDELMFNDGQLVICMANPLGDQHGIERVAATGATLFAMELIPRTSRAQAMDALSSMATIAGYEAVLIGAGKLDKIFPMLMTAAGTAAPAKVLVIGAGVAGLQAIATARRLGAVVSAYDTRAVVKEQVESLGAKFIEIEVAGDAEAAGGYARELTADEQEKQRELLGDTVAASDVVITTALVPGRPAPKIIPTNVVERMRPGAVIVDLASENGGNCELAQHGEEVEHGGVWILGPKNLPSRAPVHANELYARNVVNLLGLLVSDGELNLNMEDDIVAGTVATRGGEVVHTMLRERFGMDPLPAPVAAKSGGDE